MKTPSLAFPFILPEERVYDTGMLLRDYFAAAALSAMIAASGSAAKQLADNSYEIADEMMKRRLIEQ